MSRDEWTKTPNEKKDFVFDWANQMTLDVDTINASLMTVTPAGLTIDSPAATFAPMYATVWCSGGTANTRYLVTNKITTTAGRIHESSIVIDVKAKTQQVM